MSHNTWIHRLARVAIVRPLVGTPVTPNHLTTARLVTGVAAAAAVAVGRAPWPHIGGALFILSMVLDRADGDLARLTGRTSPSGHVYDMTTDAAANALLFIGLGAGLMGGTLGPWAITMGIAAGAGVAAVLWMVVAIERAAGPRASELHPFAGFDPDDAMLLVPVAIWLGWSAPVLIAASIGAPAFALLYLFRFRRPFFGAEG